ncbi:B12-binding domain-containing radical SAM protein [Geomonas sp. Red32]|uniref:B12-binding domain-containing radical SAM protein n=1 Tax=Geomonas sp. Red32 TaxID=2912856 RepID=UPI00202CDA31|nr:radical SAM protein [Geomonas sp. Red32]MCM0083489.1 B12-binding domain-containing radical SAM protein [Geomonas sp. Red32]
MTATLKYRRVLFVYPNYPGNHYGGENQFPPMGIGYLCEVLEGIGVETALVDMGKLWPLEYLFERIAEFRPDLVAISLMTFRYRHHYELIEAVKKRFPAIPVIGGGPHLTAWKTKVLEQCPSLDFGVSLEGEYPMKELCQGAEVGSIKGLIHRRGSDIVFNGERELVADLDQIPFPRYRSFDLSRYHSGVFLCSSRGCPYHCIFCQSKSMLGRKFRARSAGNIFEEIAYWYQLGYRHFNFVDDNFTLQKGRILELCSLLEKAGFDDLDFYVSGVRADRVDHELLVAMKRAGFTHLSFGVESASDEILKVLKKHETVEEIEAAVKTANELGFYVVLYFIVGSPHETLDDVRKSIAFAEKYASGGCNFGSLMPIPDTTLMEWVTEHGTLLMEPEHYLNDLAEYERVPYFDGPGMTLEEKKTALRITQETKERLEKRYRRRYRLDTFRNDLRGKGVAKAVIVQGVIAALEIPLVARLYNGRVKRLGQAVKKRLKL